MTYQVQIWDDEVREWFGWGFTEYDSSSKKDCVRTQHIAQRHGWKARVVAVAD